MSTPSPSSSSSLPPSSTIDSPPPPPPQPLPPGTTALTCASFTDLPVFAENIITEHLSVKDNALFGTFAKAYRLMYLRQISALRIKAEPLVEAMTKHNQASTQPLECDIDHYAQILADLLQQMPDLFYLTFETEKWHWLLHQVIGRALLLLPGPLKVERIGRMEKAKPIPPGRTSPLAEAIAAGRLPLLRSLEICENVRDIGYFWQRQNLVCLGAAITRGYLSQLTEIMCEGDEAVNIFEQAFRERLSQGQDAGDANASRPFQANIQSLIVMMVGHGWGRISELLSLPTFGHLITLRLACDDEQGDIVEEHLAAVATYIQYTEGAPCLNELAIHVSSLYQSGSMGPLMEVLENGGAPNLDTLHMFHPNFRTLEELGHLYKAGQFGKLEFLGLFDPDLDESGVRLWSEGVLASANKGAALQELLIHDPNPKIENEHEAVMAGRTASIEFLRLIGLGGFPNLECLMVENNRGKFLYGDEMVGFFIVTMRLYAPCAKTLRRLRLSLDVISPGVRHELEALLPRVELRTHIATRE